MNKKYVPYVVGLPNMGVGILWSMNLVLIPMFAATITSNNFLLGLVISMGAFTGIFVQYLAGMISDRSHFKMGRRKPFILGGCVFATIFMCLMPFTKTYLALFIIAFLFYFSLNFYQGPYYSLIPEAVEPNQIGLANGFSKVISTLGTAVIFIIGPILWSTNHSSPFFLAAFIGIVTVFVGTLLVREKTDNVITPTKISFDFIKYHSVMKLFFSVFFIFLSYGCITPFFVKYCVTVLKFPASTASNGLLALAGAGLLFAYPIGLLSDKIERRKVLLIGAFLFAIGLFFAIFAKSMILLYVILAIMGIGFIAINITIYSILAEIAPRERLGEFMGIINMFVSLSQFLANIAMGAVLDTFSFAILFPVSFSAMLIGVIIIFFSRFEKYKPV